MLRPLFITPSLEHGGAEHHSITLMNRLAERGHECHAVYIKNDTSQLPRVAIGPGRIECLDARRFFDRDALARLKRIITETQPSTIVCANPYGLMYASLALWRSRRRIPLLVTYHTTQLPNLREQVKMLLDRVFIHSADCLVFVSENQRHYWQQRGLTARRVEVIHNGVDIGHFAGGNDTAARRQARRAHGFADDDYVIGISAVIRPEKNHEQLLEAVAELYRRGVPARLLIIGDGPLRGAVEARMQELGISDAVRITGFQQDVRPHIAACDTVVLCSNAVETFSLAALEAMAMARPVVHANLGGASEMIVPGHNGYLFPVGDTATLVDRLRGLADPALAAAMGLNARNVVAHDFSEARMVDRYERLFIEVGAACPGLRRDRGSAPDAAAPAGHQS